MTKDGFFMEAHLKLRPLDFATEGIFLCGMAHYPKFISETISQANGAAVRAATILSQDTVVSSGAIGEVQEEECIGCGLVSKSLSLWGYRTSRDTRRQEGEDYPAHL